MFRTVLCRSLGIARIAVNSHVAKAPKVQCVIPARTNVTWEQTLGVPDDKVEELLIEMMNHPEFNGWDIRNLYTEVHRADYICSPKVIEAFMNACRKQNDLALAVRIMESIMYKCGTDKTVWPALKQEVKPCLDELGIPSPDELGYDKPELYCENVFDIH